MDLVDVSKRKFSKVNNGYKMILTAVDVHSRFLWAVPIRSKKIDSVLEGIKDILEQMGKPPSKISTDSEAAIKSKVIQNFFKEKNIEHRVNRSLLHCPHIERCIFMYAAVGLV